MKLVKVHIREFQSIQDSNEVRIGHVTCLVGKNESGKTALLKALYRLNPIVEEEGDFDVVFDYPRRFLSDYEDDVEAQRREHAQVIQATYELEPDDVTAVQEIFGSQCLKSGAPTLTLRKGYSNEVQCSGLSVDAEAALTHLVNSSDLPQPLTEQLLEHDTAEAMVKALADEAEQTEAARKLIPILTEISQQGVSAAAFNRILHDRIPKFLYFDEYYQIIGQDNIDLLMQRIANGTLENSDYPLLGLIELAGLNLDQLTDPHRTETLISRLEAAENRLTNKVLAYWSQNRHLRMKFDIRPGQSEDPEGMTSGMNIWGRVLDTKHMVSTTLGTRSRGFVWFFSFLAWYSQLRKEGKSLILLLDEPGLSLHAKAQSDLLRYFEEELKPNHQLIYTTHSPFMVDTKYFERVRIVQDLSLEPDSDDLPEEQEGTKVITEVLEATPDSLFPLQSALGYQIHQTLFLEPNCLVVEGASDLLFMQTVSAVLQERGREGLNRNWAITPVGGLGKVPTFIALNGSQNHVNIAVLMDSQKEDGQSVDKLYKRKLLRNRKVLSYADFVGSNQADMEDLFSPDFYLKLVNGAFGASVALTDLTNSHPRILRRVEEYLDSNPLPNNEEFDRYRPARYFSDYLGFHKNELSGQELDNFEKVFKALNALL